MLVWFVWVLWLEWPLLAICRKPVIIIQAVLMDRMVALSCRLALVGQPATMVRLDLMAHEKHDALLRHMVQPDPTVLQRQRGLPDRRHLTDQKYHTVPPDLMDHLTLQAADLRVVAYHAVSSELQTELQVHTVLQVHTEQQLHTDPQVHTDHFHPVGLTSGSFHGFVEFDGRELKLEFRKRLLVTRNSG